MAEKTGQCELTPDSASAKVQDADIDQGDKRTALNLLDAIKKDGDTSSVAPGSASDNKPLKCLTERDVLDTLLLKGVKTETIKTLDEKLVPEKASAVDRKNIKYIAYDGPNGEREHLNTVAGVILARDSSVSKDNIILGSIEPERKPDPNRPPLVPYDLDLTDEQRQRFANNIARGQQMTEDLKSFLPIVKENPGVVINISADLFNLALIHPDSSVKKSRPTAISANTLGIDLPKTLDQITPDTAREIKAALELRKDFDVRAKTLLDLVGAINTLADNGAKVRIAWGNKDQVLLTELIAQLHPNVAAVSAEDWKGAGISYNRRTAGLAKESAPGTVFYLPAAVADKVDSSQIRNATLIKDAHDEDDTVSGKRLGEVLLRDKDVPRLKEKMTAWYKLAGSADMAADIIGRDLSKKDYEDSWKQVYEDIKKTLPAEIKQLGSRDEFVKKMEDNRLKLGKAEDRERFEATVTEVGKKLALADLKKLGYQPDAEHPDLNSLFLKFDADLRSEMSGKLFSEAQLRKIYDTYAEQFFKKNENKGHGYFYRLNTPDITQDKAVQRYWALKTQDNTLVVARESTGTSFASPSSAARARQKMN